MPWLWALKRPSNSRVQERKERELKMKLKLIFDKETKEYYVYLYDGSKFTQKIYLPKTDVGAKPPSLLVFDAESADVKPIKAVVDER
jgi:hypothetical protein